MRHATRLEAQSVDTLVSDYKNLLRLARPELVPHPTSVTVLASRTLIAHAADVPILVSAIQAKPDWLLTNNRKHFTAEVARRTGLRIGSPASFFDQLAKV